MFNAFMSVSFPLFKSGIAVILAVILISMPTQAQSDPPQPFKIEIGDAITADLGQNITIPVSKTEGDRILEGFDFLIKYQNFHVIIIELLSLNELLASCHSSGDRSRTSHNPCDFLQHQTRSEQKLP